MLSKVEIKSVSSPYFKECWRLYEESFPEDERRELWYQEQTLMCDNYHFDALVVGEELIGLVGWWSFDSVTYIEHLAILPQLRNGGYGQMTLSMFKDESRKPIILEVEHPNTPITARRVAFYQREGFLLNPHHYTHPPYRGEGCVELLIMSYPQPISLSELESFKSRYFPVIHFR